MPDFTLEIGGQVFEVAHGPSGRVRATGGREDAAEPAAAPEPPSELDDLRRRVAELEDDNAGLAAALGALRSERERDLATIDALIAQIRPLIGFIAKLKPHIEEV